MASRDDVVVAGLPLAEHVLSDARSHAWVERPCRTGTRRAGTVLMRLSGNARKMLAAERSALNTLQHLTGIATLTRAYVREIQGTGCILLDTRKTIPGLRALAKYASRRGGAQNHRMRLDDGILIKDNHVAVCGGVAEAVAAARQANRGLQVQVEVDRLDQIEPALAAGAERLLLDNMPPPVLRKAVELVGGRVPTEASGGVRLDTIRGIAETGVTYVSVGRITQSAPAADIGMDYA
jgi:nicotinate-nucleotide pyrophosphorylase (carboxylating)